MTADQQHLTISLNSVVNIYQNNQTQFELLESIQLSRDSLFSSISHNKELLLISTSHETYVYANATTGNTSLVQTLVGSRIHAFSKESEYVVLGKENEVHVYLYCDYDQSGGFYNSTEGFCHCQPEKDRFFENGSCQACNLSNCLDCQNLTNCLSCDESNDYFLVNHQCQACSLANCLDCQNTTVCLQCDEGVGAYLDPLTSSCYFCQLEGCLQCSSEK